MHLPQPQLQAFTQALSQLQPSLLHSFLKGVDIQQFSRLVNLLPVTLLDTVTKTLSELPPKHLEASFQQLSHWDAENMAIFASELKRLNPKNVPVALQSIVDDITLGIESPLALFEQSLEEELRQKRIRKNKEETKKQEISRVEAYRGLASFFDSIDEKGWATLAWYRHNKELQKVSSPG